MHHSSGVPADFNWRQMAFSCDYTLFIFVVEVKNSQLHFQLTYLTNDNFEKYNNNNNNNKK